MGVPQIDGKIEGWLYLIGSNRIGVPFSRKQYFIFRDSCLGSYKTAPTSDRQEPDTSAVIDSFIRVTDNGRENIHKKELFVFTLYRTSNHNEQLKLGASSSEEAARWIHSFQDAAVKEINSVKNFVACSSRNWPSLRLVGSKRKKSIDWSFYSSRHMDATTSDVIAPSPWKIFGCQNGLRLFREAKDGDSRGGVRFLPSFIPLTYSCIHILFSQHWDDHPAIMAVGVAEGTPEAIFRTLMSLGPSRSEWDFCFYRGSVVEHLDGHTDIIHKELYSDWLPWGMKRRDLLLRRYWRREDDGTYVILYHSIHHNKCQPKKGYTRAWLKSGGYVITPVNQGTQSLVKHMLSIDWKCWKSYLRPASGRAITIRMLERVAALRELCKAKTGDYCFEVSSRELPRNIALPGMEKGDIKTKVGIPEEIEKIERDMGVDDEVEKHQSGRSSLIGFHEAADEFFDVPEPTEYDHNEEWLSERSPDHPSPKQSSAAVFVKKLHNLAVPKKGYVELQETGGDENPSCVYGSTLLNDPGCNSACSWTAADPSSFLIRGKNYLEDRQKIKAKHTLMQMVGADWLRCDKREDDLGSRPGGIVQNYAANGGPEFFFIVNIQVPGATMYNLALYYMIKTPLEENLLLKRFVEGDDAYRNSRFKLIPYISKGSWIVKQSVGKKACLVGQALEVNYFRGTNYLELGVDVGSSTVARGVVNLVLGYLNNLVIEMAFLIQGNTQDELPEVLLGTCKLNHLDIAKSVLVKP